MRLNSLAGAVLLALAACLAAAGASAQTPAPNIVTSPAAGGSIAFGNARLGSLSSQTVTIQNFGTAALTVSGFAFFGTNATAFALPSPPTLPATISAGNQLIVSVGFYPTSIGSKSATFRISSDDPDEPTVDINLGGTGVRSYISLNTTAIDFGIEPVGETTPAFIVSVRNLNNASATTLNVVISLQVGDGQYLVNPNVPFQLLPNGTQFLSLYFTPNALGTQSEKLILSSDDPDNPVIQIDLSGEGIAAGSSLDLQSGCLIETLAAGSPLQEQLAELRQLRGWLRRSVPFGPRLVRGYYALSAAVAPWLRRHEDARSAARWAARPVLAAVLHPLPAALLLGAAGLLLAFRRRR
jgi:hypothetical protein